jgi:hypothetical protein
LSCSISAPLTGAVLKTQQILSSEINAIGAKHSIFNRQRFPKLDVARSIPVSRSFHFEDKNCLFYYSPRSGVGRSSDTVDQSASGQHPVDS